MTDKWLIVAARPGGGGRPGPGGPGGRPAPRPHTQTGPPVSATRPSLVLFSRDLCDRMCAIAIALVCPHPPRTHAPRPHTQTGPPVSATRPSLALFSRALCARMCAIAIALAQQHPPPSPPAAFPSLPPSSLLTTPPSPVHQCEGVRLLHPRPGS